MKIACLTGIRQVEIREVPLPRITAPDDVLLRVEVVGVCGSDMHYYRMGRIGSQVVEFPWSVGHELSGTVAEVGAAVASLKVGDRVAVDPLIPCGGCDQCRAGRMHTCRKQKFLGCPGQASGALAQYVVMPAGCCYRIPDSMSMVLAALVEPLSIGLYAWRMACAAMAGGRAPKSAAILGCGPIGLSVLAAMKGRGGAGTAAYVTDIRDNRLAMAARFGADWTGNPHRQEVAGGIIEACPEGLDVVFECAGQQETIDQAIGLLAPGGALLLVGIPEADRVEFSPDTMRRRELRIFNVRRQNECVADAIELAAGDAARIESMATHHFELSRVKEAFDVVADYRDNVVKAMMHV